jgi:hypothetical protein
MHTTVTVIHIIQSTAIMTTSFSTSFDPRLIHWISIKVKGPRYPVALQLRPLLQLLSHRQGPLKMSREPIAKTFDHLRAEIFRQGKYIMNAVTIQLYQVT